MKIDINFSNYIKKTLQNKRKKIVLNVLTVFNDLHVYLTVKQTRILIRLSFETTTTLKKLA